MTVHICPACNLPLPADAPGHQKYHTTEQCQQARFRKNNAIAHANRDKDRKVERICVICGCVFFLVRGQKACKKTCSKPECVLALRKQVGKECGAKKQETFKEVVCLGHGPEHTFKTPLDMDGRPLYRICPRCTKARRHDESYRWVGVWG